MCIIAAVCVVYRHNLEFGIRRSVYRDSKETATGQQTVGLSSSGNCRRVDVVITVRPVIRAEDGIKPTGGVEPRPHFVCGDCPSLIGHMAGYAPAAIRTQILKKRIVEINGSVGGKRLSESTRVRKRKQVLYLSVFAGLAENENSGNSDQCDGRNVDTPDFHSLSSFC